MSEHSYYHNGAVAGDAVEAPYNSELYTKINSIIRSSGDSFVFPLYLNELLVTHTGAAIQVDTGAANVGGALYVNDAAVTLNLVANSSIYERIDRVIIRADWTAHTIRLAIKTGKPAILPSPPDLVQKAGVLWEISLAYFFAGHGATYLIDEREFANTSLHANTYVGDNHFPDSEFMSLDETGADSYYPALMPAYWQFTGIETEAFSTTKFDRMDRGSVWDFTLPRAGTDYCNLNMQVAGGSSIAVTIRLLIKVLAGEVQFSEASSATVLGIIPPTNGVVEIILRPTIFGAANPLLQLQVEGTVDDTHFKIGQITLAYGKIGCPFGTKHEIVLFGKAYQPSVPTLNDGETLIASEVRKGTKAIIAEMAVGDTGSAGASTCFAGFRGRSSGAVFFRIHVGGHPNNRSLNGCGIIGIEHLSFPLPAVEDNIMLYIDRTGAAATMGANPRYFGIIT